jgi:galactoside O-acetyltransferase
MTSVDNAQRKDAGLVYNPGDTELMNQQNAGLELLFDFNATRPSQSEERSALLRRMFASVGERCYIEPPLHANWGGANVTLGNDVYANFNLTLVDDGQITIGDNVMFGPNVVVTTAGHPVLPALRLRAAQYNLPVRIGSNVWIGSGVQIMPGVTIGNDTVVGAGSVVTRDLPASVVALGAPCRILRDIGEHDRVFYQRERMFDMPLEDIARLFDA